MRPWLLRALFVLLFPWVSCWNKRITADLRDIAYAPEKDYEWTKTAETKFYKRGGEAQVGLGSSPDQLYPSDMREAADSGGYDRRAWAGPEDIGYFKRPDMGSSNFYKRLHDAEKKPNPTTFAYDKRAGPGSFGMYKRSDPGSFGFYKRGSPASFGFYKRGPVGGILNPGEFPIYKRNIPGDLNMHDRRSPRDVALQRGRIARPGDVPLWKRSL